MDKQFRWLTKKLSPGGLTAARDYYYTMEAVGCDPLRPTADNLKKGYESLVEQNAVSARARYSAWIRALHSLPEDYQRQIGADRIPAAQRGSSRVVMPRDGEFPQLEEDMREISAIAKRPRDDAFDDHQPRTELSMERARRRILVIAKRLREAGLVDEGVSLRAILALSMQRHYVTLAYGLAPPNDEGSTEQDDALSGEPVLQFHLYDDFAALSLLSSVALGKGCEEALFARDQARAHQKNGLNDSAIETITRLTQRANLMKIHGLDKMWIEQAEGSSNLKTRRSMADLAAAVSIYKIAPVRPGELTAMKIDGDGSPIIPPRHREIVGSIEIPHETLEIIRRRNVIRDIEPGTESWLFPGVNGPQLQRSVTAAFSSATEAAGLSGLTLQRLRDICGKLVYDQDPRRFRDVSAILGYAQTRTARLRYQPFHQPMIGRPA
jgi:hypothetical protein